jgi:hypothetical protein
MKKNQTQRLLCEKFCRYYKPGKNEALACRGYTVIERVVQAGRMIDFERYGRTPDGSAREMVRQRMCPDCAFHRQDCDFMQDRAAPPCGGFVLVTQLIGGGVISADEIAEP